MLSYPRITTKYPFNVRMITILATPKHVAEKRMNQEPGSKIKRHLLVLQLRLLNTNIAANLELIFLLFQ